VKGRHEGCARGRGFLVQYACLDLCQLMPAGRPCQVEAGLLGLFINSLVHLCPSIVVAFFLSFFLSFSL